MILKKKDTQKTNPPDKDKGGLKAKAEYINDETSKLEDLIKEAEKKLAGKKAKKKSDSCFC